MALMYPQDCDSPRKRTEFLYKAQETLRLLHNIYSKWLHKGLTEEEYNWLPEKIRDKYSYVPNLSETDFAKFKDKVFTPKSDRICQEICVQRALLKTSDWSIDLGDI